MADNSMKSCRVLLYVQHLLGIGHLVRASRIASALKDAGFDVAVVMGGMPVSGFPGSRPSSMPMAR
jgi:predicted glycosyltransferase